MDRALLGNIASETALAVFDFVIAGTVLSSFPVYGREFRSFSNYCATGLRRQQS